MNPLNDILPATVRKYVYAAYVIAGLVIGALAVAGVDVGKAPDVMTYLAIPIGALAVSNTTPKPEPVPDEEYPDEYPEGEDDYDGEPLTTEPTNPPPVPSHEWSRPAYGTQPPLHQPGSDEDGFGGDAPLPGPENGSERF